MSGLTAILECLGQAEPPPQEQVKRFFVTQPKSEGPKKGEYENYFFKTMMFSVAKFEII
jgi:hypothetical protein